MPLARSWWHLYVLIAIILTGSEMSKVSGIEVAHFQSDWLRIKSYDSTHSLLRVEHNLGEVPIKVKVIVTPTSQPYSGWLFEAGSSQQADDDYPWLYCGILYIYDVSSVYLFAPVRSNDFNDTGKAFCIDSLSWTSSSSQPTINQTEDKVLVKVFAWKSSSFPNPDVDSKWLSVVAGEAPYFFEVSHNMKSELSLVHLQIRCYYERKLIYAEGVGAGSIPAVTGNYSDVGGLVFGYNSTHTRIWNPNRSFNKLILIGDGYPHYMSSCTSGEFRVRGWKSLGREPQQFSFKLNGLSYDKIPDMSNLKVNMKQWNPLTNYISVQVKALDGPNEGFVFPAIGQVHRNAYPGTSYGGVVFGYSATNIRIFVPADESGTIIHIPKTWGIEKYQQMTNNVIIIIKMWNTVSNHCSARKLSSWMYTRLENVPCSTWMRFRCVILCLSDIDCIGITSCLPTDECRLMNLDTVNNRMIDGILGDNGEVLLHNYVCK